MKLSDWYQKRGVRFIYSRARKLGTRYGFSARQATRRIQHCMETLSQDGCFPTFAVPGFLVKRYMPFILNLQAQGAELAVHGYNHEDLRTFPPQVFVQEFMRAKTVFQKCGLSVYGFRCPYLSVTDEMIEALPPGLFGYSSNKAVQYPVGEPDTQIDQLLFQTIQSFYEPERSESVFCLPWFQAGLVEIPVCVPDDLQLFDGLGFSLDAIGNAWLAILMQTHQRGEVFNLIFHPELASFCETPFTIVLKAAHALRPRVWVAQLCEVSAWWREKDKFKAITMVRPDGYTIRFENSPRATLLYRGLPAIPGANPWADRYIRLNSTDLEINGAKLPFLGISDDSPQEMVTFLRNMGYIVETGNLATSCELYLDRARLEKFTNRVALVDFIERSPDALVRYWPWPDGARSALCITGDLDALTLFDYTSRLFMS